MTPRDAPRSAGRVHPTSGRAGAEDTPRPRHRVWVRESATKTASLGVSLETPVEEDTPETNVGAIAARETRMARRRMPSSTGGRGITPRALRAMHAVAKLVRAMVEREPQISDGQIRTRLLETTAGGKVLSHRDVTRGIGQARRWGWM